MATAIQQRLIPLEGFVRALDVSKLARVGGNAVYMTGNPGMTPTALTKNLQHQQTLHERVVILTVTTEAVPYIRAKDRLVIEDLPHGFHRVTARYGFMETPDALTVLKMLSRRGLDLPLEHTTFFLGRERPIASGLRPLDRLKVRLFSFMGRNSQRATAFFNIPSDRVVEVGMQIEL